MHEERDCQISEISKPSILISNGDKESIIYNDCITKNNIIVQNKTGNLMSSGIVILNATAKWTKNQTVNSLENIKLTVRPDRLVAIIGPVGAGKV